jgi:hypothetical protein
MTATATATADRPCVDCLDQPQAAKRTSPAVPRRVAFWLVAVILCITMLGTTLPTPLYGIYQGQWHFSTAIVTVTFAAYAAGVLATLLLAGRSSDQAGRKPVLAAALGAMVGLGLGPLIAGLFAQYAPQPTVLVFEVYLGVLAAAGLCLLFVPEPVSPRRGGLGVHQRLRSRARAVHPACWPVPVLPHQHQERSVARIRPPAVRSAADRGPLIPAGR